MNAIYYVIHTLLQLALFVMVSRLLMQWCRADFRNPIAETVVRLTNPLVLPLRRVLRPIGKIDTATVVAVLLVTVVELAVSYLLLLGGVPSDPIFWVRQVALELVVLLLNAYFYMILLYALLSMIAPGGYSPAQALLASLCEPVLRPFRRFGPIGGLDLSPLWAGITIQALLILLRDFSGGQSLL